MATWMRPRASRRCIASRSSGSFAGTSCASESLPVLVLLVFELLVVVDDHDGCRRHKHRRCDDVDANADPSRGRREAVIVRPVEIAVLDILVVVADDHVDANRVMALVRMPGAFVAVRDRIA